MEPSPLASAVLGLDRRSRWELVGARSLRFDAHHPQGMTRLAGHWWITTVDVDARQGWVLVVDDDGALVERIAVGDGDRYHPGGTDSDGTALWVACAEYRPHSSTSVLRLAPGSPPEPVFEVDDHVGAIARAGPDGDLVGWTWGSRRFLRWRVDGTAVTSRPNPGGFVDHQDGQWIGAGRVLCGGVGGLRLPSGPAPVGGLALLRVDDLVVEHEVPFPGYSPSGRVGTHNPLWAEATDAHLLLHLLPDDGVGTIFTWATPLTGR